MQPCIAGAAQLLAEKISRLPPFIFSSAAKGLGKAFAHIIWIRDGAKLNVLTAPVYAKMLAPKGILSSFNMVIFV